MDDRPHKVATLKRGSFVSFRPSGTEIRILSADGPVSVLILSHEAIDIGRCVDLHLDESSTGGDTTA